MQDRSAGIRAKTERNPEGEESQSEVFEVHFGDIADKKDGGGSAEPGRLVCGLDMSVCLSQRGF